MFVNTGVLAVLPDATTAGSVSFTGLEGTTNTGLIDMRNGHTGDVLTLSGDFAGSGNSTLGIDVEPTTDGGTSDRLVVAGAATGSTTIVADALSAAPGSLINGALVVDAGAGTSADAFTLPATSVGLIDYSLAYDATGNDFRLYGTPNGSAYAQTSAVEGARELFFHGTSIIGSHLDQLGDLAQDGATSADGTQRSRALWGILYGRTDHRDRDVATTLYNVPVSFDLGYRQDMFGAQIGYDFGGVGLQDGMVFGVTAGYSNSTLSFTGSADRMHFDAANAGAYFRVNSGMLFASGIAKYERYWITSYNRTIAYDVDFNGNGYGGKLRAGARLGSDGFFAEPAISMEYVKTDLDSLTALGSTFDYDSSDGFRGKAGLRVGTVINRTATVMRVYAGGAAVKEWKGRDDVTFSNNGQSIALRTDRLGTYGEFKAGFSANVNNRVSGFIEGHAEVSGDYSGGGGRAGLSIRF
nr:autotransporter outer membrane beta-barrel domain-containing protein [Stakelama flava]